MKSYQEFKSDLENALKELLPERGLQVEMKFQEVNKLTEATKH